MTDLTALSLAEAREALTSKTVTSVELTEAHLAAIDRAKGLNAYVAVTADQALEMAKASDARIARGDLNGIRSESLPLLPGV